MKTLILLPHPSGPWLARVGKRNFSITAELGQALLPMQGEALDGGRVRELLAGDAALVEAVLSWADAEVPGQKSWHPQRTIWGRCSLVPQQLVRGIAGNLTALAGGRLLLAMAVLGVGFYGAFFVFADSGHLSASHFLHLKSGNWQVLLPGLGLFFLTGIWHEIGHATALAKEGYAPGRIGVGLLLVIPVLFAEVTAVGMLNRRGRLRVDVAGVVFQIFAGGSLLILTLVSRQWPLVTSSLYIAGLSSLVAVVWSLLPFVRSDGYWALADYLGVENLDVPWAVSGSTSRATGWLMIVFRLANIAFLILLGVMIPWRLARWMEYLGWWPAPWSGLAGGVFQMVSGLVLLMIWVGLARHGGKLGRATWEDLKALG